MSVELVKLSMPQCIKQPLQSFTLPEGDKMFAPKYNWMIIENNVAGQTCLIIPVLCCAGDGGRYTRWLQATAIPGTTDELGKTAEHHNLPSHWFRQDIHSSYAHQGTVTEPWQVSVCFLDIFFPFGLSLYLCLLCFRGKRSFFMVNTVALVSQQAAYIRRHSHHSVGEYSGDLNLDFWTKEIWQQELSQNQVQFPDKDVCPNWLSLVSSAVCFFFCVQILVMTCQIFLNMLMHGYIELSEINLLIFDECHHAVNDQPMRQVMQLFEHCPRELQPRILGLTATLLNSNCKFGRVKEEVRSLEKTFLSKVATCENMPVVGRYGCRCCLTPNS